MKKLLILLLICFALVGCNETKEPTEETKEPTKEPTKEEVYVPTDTTITFSDENASKVITESNFNVKAHTNEAKDDIKVHQLFQSGMCLQRDSINRIWGKAVKTENVAIEINGQVYYGTVNGREWEVYLPKMNAGGPYEMAVVTDTGRITLKDVYIGEVFLLSGQSNMEMQMKLCNDAVKEYYKTAACVNDKIRMMNVPFFPQAQPTDEVINSCKWVGASQTTVAAFTAVGYLFGRQMQEELGCPVGLISSYIGGSSIEFWMSEKNYSKVQEIYKPYTTSEVYMTPTQGYNGMLYPLSGLNIRSMVWYQGESNAFGTQEYYDQALKIFLDQCRELFANEQLGFTICELARYEGNPQAYSIVNQKINEVAKEDSYVVVARNVDLGDWFDIHPKDKREISRRAAYETLRVFFKQDKPAPITVSSYTFNEDGSVTITLSKDAELVNGHNGFEVCVNGKYSYNCNVSISGNTLTVTSDGEITSVRYAYTCNMTDEIKNDVSKMVTVYDKDGFPLDLFLISK